MTGWLITGGSGLLGTEIRQQLTGTIAYHAPTSSELDISSASDFANLPNPEKFTGVIHCAAAVNVDVAERAPGQAYGTNAMGTAHVANFCKKYNLPMVYVSTDYVFSGRDEPIVPWVQPNPINMYGYSKLAGEDIVRYILPNKHLIFRTSSLYGQAATGYVSYVMERMLSGLVNTDQPFFWAPKHRFFQPTPAKLVAKNIIMALAQVDMGGADTFGTYHLTSTGLASHFDVATVIRNVLATKSKEFENIEIVEDKDWSDRTPRPRVSMLDSESTWADIKSGFPIGPWRNALTAEVSEIRDYVDTNLVLGKDSYVR